MPSIEEVLVETWWDAAECRPVVIAESTYRQLYEGVFGRRFTRSDARAFAALLTGLRTTAPIGIDVGEFAHACVVDAYVADTMLGQLRDAGLLSRHHRGYEAATGRRGWSWQLSGGLLWVPERAPTLILEPTFHPDRGMVEIHARSYRRPDAA